MRNLDIKQWVPNKPKRSRRLYKLDSLLAQELGKIFSKELEPPLGTLISIGEVRVSADLHKAQVKISILPFTERQEVFLWLNRQIGMIQYELNRVLYLYHVPKIIFVLDETEEKASRIELLLDNIDRSS